MALKTFNLDEEIYSEFSKHCKKKGMSMSKKIENFISGELEKIKLETDKKEKSENNPKEDFKRERERFEDEHPLRKYC